MFPTNGLITPPIPGDLEVGLRYRERKKEIFLGGPTLGSETNPKVYTGARNAEWSFYYDRRTFWYAVNGVVTQQRSISSVSELTACLDSYQMLTLCYRQSKKWILEFYDPFDRQYIVRELAIDGMTTPRMCYDDSRIRARSVGSVILAYYVKNELYVLTSDNGFSIPRLIRTEETDENYLSQVSMGTNGRLHFVTYTLKDE